MEGVDGCNFGYLTCDLPRAYDVAMAKHSLDQSFIAIVESWAGGLGRAEIVTEDCE